MHKVMKNSHGLKAAALQIIKFAAMPDSETYNDILRCTSVDSGKTKDRPRSCCTESEYKKSKVLRLDQTSCCGMRETATLEGPDQNSIDLETIENESHDLVQPLPCITRKNRSHTEVNAVKSRRLSTPQPIKQRAVRSPLIKSTSNAKCRLQKSKSAPELSGLHTSERKSFQASSEEAGDLAVVARKLSADEDDRHHMHVPMPGSTKNSNRLEMLGKILDRNQVTYADALWDHMTVDSDELRFRAGDVIEVIDMVDKDWWCGKVSDREGKVPDREGWFPSAFVMLRTISPNDLLDESFDMVDNAVFQEENCKPSRAEQARAHKINELILSEREFVKHLRDVIEGYVEKAKKRQEMFSPECIATIFGNIEQIYKFASEFLCDLERNVTADRLHLSNIGNCFIKHQKGFEIYSEYCNNHPQACEELRKLKTNRKYQHFFEACRLMQQMIEIPLEGFLLTPVQKICQYPLQLKELIKFTNVQHPDHSSLEKALAAMKRTAELINERKRKMESLEKLSRWQNSVADWQGPALLDSSSELIYSGEVNKVSSSGWLLLRALFLFDHQLIILKKDILWKDMFVYKGRIDTNKCTCTVFNDGKDMVKHGLKLHDQKKDKWFLFCCRSQLEQDRWLRAFEEERQTVERDNRNGFDLSKFKNKIRIVPFRTKEKEKLFRKKNHITENNISHSTAENHRSSPQSKRNGILTFMQRNFRR